jgi:hypothetical protein
MVSAGARLAGKKVIGFFPLTVGPDVLLRERFVIKFGHDALLRECAPEIRQGQELEKAEIASQKVKVKIRGRRPADLITH